MLALAVATVLYLEKIGDRHDFEPGRQVLTDAVVFKLADAAVGIRAVFGGRAQDIEWVVAGGVVMIVQARPL